MNSPFITKFAAQTGDILLTGVDSAKKLQVLRDNVLILQEYYDPDADHCIRVTGLADVLTTSLFGELSTGVQSNAKARIAITMTGEEGVESLQYAMRFQNPHDPSGLKQVMAVAEKGVCYPGTPLLITVIGRVTVKLMNDDARVAVTTIGTDNAVTTVDCDPTVLFPLDSGNKIVIGDEVERVILGGLCEDNVCIRFLNRYDMPETLVAQYMSEKPQTQDDVAIMYGKRLRMDVKSTTDYTLHSGHLHFPEEVETWYDLIMSRKAQVSLYGQWYDIVVTKSNVNRQRRKLYGSQIEVSFQTANPNMIL